ncbi:MAG: type I-E CRISPR-associated protein Cas6/Cse3/CasE [Bacillota bacterium]|nr:MAG: type I-E CRISPR-associated protein Cas6/Cse3/CasE [Bacillota bacterium]
MYLSRLILNPKNRAVRRDLGDLQSLHRTLMSAFPSAQGPRTARAEMGLLYRIELEPRSPGVPLIVQSLVQPNWSYLEPGYLLDCRGSLGVKRVDQIYESIQPGSLLRFRLRANATKKVDTKTGPDGIRRNGRRVPLTDPDAALRWLERKAAESGFRLVDVAQNPGLPDVAAIPAAGRRGTGVRGSQKVTVDSVLFEGRLQVIDKTSFLRALGRGIGPAKAYGCGLLSVARG